MLKFVLGFLSMWAFVTLVMFTAEFLELEKPPTIIKLLAGIIVAPAAGVFWVYKLFKGLFIPTSKNGFSAYKRCRKNYQVWNCGSLYFSYDKNAEWFNKFAFFRVV